MGGQENKPLGHWQRLGLYDQRRAATTWQPTASGLSQEETVSGRDPSGNLRHLATNRMVLRGCRLDGDGGQPGIQPIDALYLTAQVTVAEHVSDLPRVGISFELAESYEHVAYFGLVRMKLSRPLPERTAWPLAEHRRCHARTIHRAAK